MDASKEDREKIIKAIRKGGIRFSPRASESLSKMKPGKADFTITGARVASVWGEWKKENCLGNKGGFSIDWETVSAGFGSMGLFVDFDNQLWCDNEAMGPVFLKTVIDKWLENIVIETTSGKDTFTTAEFIPVSRSKFTLKVDDELVDFEFKNNIIYCNNCPTCIKDVWYKIIDNAKPTFE